MRTAVVLLALFGLLLARTAFAVDPQSSVLPPEEQDAAEAHALPKLQTDVAIRTGYRVADVHGSREAAEYEYPKDSILFGGDLRFVPADTGCQFDVVLPLEPVGGSTT